MTLTQQVSTILKLSKKESKYITEAENSKKLNSDTKGKKIVLHFNNKFKDEINNNKIDMEMLEGIISLATLVVFEIDSATFEKYQDGGGDESEDKDYLSVITKFAIDVSISQYKKVNITTFIDQGMTDLAI